MKNSDSNTFSIIKNTANRFFPDCKVLLFGSRAKKSNDTDSDYDFLIITREIIDIRKKRTIKSLIRRELAKLKIPADVLIQSEEEINYKKEITGHILKHVSKEGIAL